MNAEITIPKNKSSDLGPGYSQLREAGQAYISRLASALWTDYNTHDPGITILEMLCYAITDLDYRLALPVEDVLASERENTRRMHEQFRSALDVMPGAPVTANDYRQLLIRLDGVRNAWLSKAEHPVIARYKRPPDKPRLRYQKPGETAKLGEELVFPLLGLNNILVDFEEFPELGGNALLIKQKQAEIIRQIKSVYHYFRNLGEDLDQVTAVPEQEIVICAEIQLEAKADPEETWALIISAIENYLNPRLPFYSLQELLDRGLPTDAIFEGPVYDFEKLTGLGTPSPLTKKGFVTAEDLDRSTLRTEVRLSDLYRLLLNIPGVRLVKKIAFGFCPCNEAALKAKEIADSPQWLLCVTPGYKPVLCVTGSAFNFYKDVIPIQLKKAEAQDRLQQMRANAQAALRQRVTEDLPIPEGRYRNPALYTTLQNQFPENYGLSPAGLPDSAGPQRKALALQSKAYLLFFDQVLANFFTQLAQAKTLLSANDTVRKTYFANAVAGIRDIGKIFPAAETNWIEQVEQMMQQNQLDPYAARKNRFLDHLLSRFAEQFNEYVFIMYRIYGEDYDRSIIRNKVNFLQDYRQMSANRGSARDMLNPQEPEAALVNVSGLEKRLSRLLGFNTYKQLRLTEERYKIEKTGPNQYNWRILKEGTAILKGPGSYPGEYEAYEALGLASVLAADREFYQLTAAPAPDTRFFTLTDSRKKLVGLSETAFPGATIETIIAEFITWIRENFKMEGMYVVEHLLLRPPFDYPGDDAGTQQFMPVCIDPNGNYCPPLDPYSFRISIILPGYTLRLRNPAFRQYAERLIRLETPAHILPRICFIGAAQMAEFEALYPQWLQAKTLSLQDNTPMNAKLNTDFIQLLERLFTVYEQGFLSDCDDDTKEKNPIILGQTNLGSLGTG